jgi:hypothetical protein
MSAEALMALKLNCSSQSFFCALTEALDGARQEMEQPSCPPFDCASLQLS